ncbi:hypothetical protein BDV39DRAFT_182288 [Aspergillus sergii]|uniref:Secreted protein n=1 Tax=Aspergillus sergii TaxID=1034303 RepID=A0A5N6WRR5_9EURO|nr:hypothetical protein BDV39DRAFT_182288 [Aspergillus sergii]
MWHVALVTCTWIYLLFCFFLPDFPDQCARGAITVYIHTPSTCLGRKRKTVGPSQSDKPKVKIIPIQRLRFRASGTEYY